MDFDAAKQALRSGYLKYKFELADEHARQLFFRDSIGDSVTEITEGEIQEYADFDKRRQDFQAAPVECSICSKDYREHMLTFSERDRGRPMVFLSRDPVTFGNPDGDNPFIEIGPASSDYINFFRFDEAYMDTLIDRRRMRGGSRFGPDLSYRPLTIKVKNLRQSTVEKALTISSQIIDACLFHLSYVGHVTLLVSDEWPRREQRQRGFVFEKAENSKAYSAPRLIPNSDIVRIYQRGLGTTDVVIQFLSFYQVLEYYFLRASDDFLYTKLSRRLQDPKFSVTQPSLDKLIQEVIEHKRESDETEMLKLVLVKYIDESALIEFIRAYESYLAEPIYTKKMRIFGEEVETKLQQGHVCGNVARRIKTIRNALVHSSDRYERNDRYIPTRVAEVRLRKELPLLRFLAEKVIIATSTSLNPAPA